MNIQLRKRTEEHVRIYFDRVQDPQIRAVLHHSSQTVEQAVENFHKTQLPGANSYGRTIYADDVYIGDVWCYCIDLREDPNAMIGYCIFEKSFWGKGIGTAVVEQFLTEVKPKFQLASVGAFVYCENLASQHVLEKNGFRQVESFTEDGVASFYYQKAI